MRLFPQLACCREKGSGAESGAHSVYWKRLNHSTVNARIVSIGNFIGSISGGIQCLYLNSGVLNVTGNLRPWCEKPQRYQKFSALSAKAGIWRNCCRFLLLTPNPGLQKRPIVLPAAAEALRTNSGRAPGFDRMNPVL